MKKVIALGLVLVMVLCVFAGCGGDENEASSYTYTEPKPTRVSDGQVLEDFLKGDFNLTGNVFIPLDKIFDYVKDGVYDVEFYEKMSNYSGKTSAYRNESGYVITITGSLPYTLDNKYNFSAETKLCTAVLTYDSMGNHLETEITDYADVVRVLAASIYNNSLW